MAVKFLVSFGVNVTVISRSNAKEEEAKKELGATHFLNSSDKDQMAAAMGTLDFIIDTAPGAKLLSLSSEPSCSRVGFGLLATKLFGCFIRVCAEMLFSLYTYVCSEWCVSNLGVYPLRILLA